HHFNCPGLEGVWFISPVAIPSAAIPVAKNAILKKTHKLNGGSVEVNRIMYELCPGVNVVSDEFFNTLFLGRQKIFGVTIQYCDIAQHKRKICEYLARSATTIREVAELSDAGRDELIRRLAVNGDILIKRTTFESPELTKTLYHEWTHRLHIIDDTVRDKLNKGFDIISGNASLSF
ncbi:unnamed protein product, partial [marine sediment metagenome]